MQNKCKCYMNIYPPLPYHNINWSLPNSQYFMHIALACGDPFLLLHEFVSAACSRELDKALFV